ncbi:MAG TPA: hypothetical protein VL463_09810 [Kofleriaceae bacterium]|nr:hypothetical protein [Kofleriaceae bacterium]
MMNKHVLLVSGLAGALAGCDQFGGGGGGGDLALPSFDDHVTAFYCASPTSCVIATDQGSGPGHLYATDGASITATIFTGDRDFAAKVGTDGEVGFSGFTKVGDKLMVLVDGAASAYVTASGDITKPESWTIAKLGTQVGPNTNGPFGLNQQNGLFAANGQWTYVVHNVVLTSSAGPAPSTIWNWTWSPQAQPSVPENLDDLRAADPTLCNSDPGADMTPASPQSIYVASDLIVTPAGSYIQDGSDAPGVCISLDHGHSFHHAAFANAANGPNGINCTSQDHCVAYADVPFGGDGAAPIVFVSTDASKGAASTWKAATTPAVGENTLLRNLVFAPDGMHGWILGWHDGATPLLFATSDGGATWSDASGSLGADSFRPYGAYAFDATHLWVGGDWIGGDARVINVTM